MDNILSYSNGANTLAFVIIAFLIGIVLACVLMLWQIKVPGAIVRTLLKAGADAPERAIGADKLGMSEALLRFVLKDTGALAKYVRVIPGKTVRQGKQTRPVYTDARYYLAPETRDRAAIRYDRRRASVGALIAAIVVFSACAVVLTFIIPDLIRMLENFLAMFHTVE